MKDRICAVIVTYNCGENFLNTFKSVENQVDKIVIVDNGSTENTIRMLNKLKSEKKLRLFYVEIT